ncbi:leucine-rich repeat domain-containing protein [Yinghuangia seranimata]|uniref:leucine-rich repeat domain-containing protein n=1 Tax=Yinghuangia seranimata TaxID=408067 RepID=UPI00248C4739|nr:leucine-rich repeat domain-containing protein [Yinghuangia seranimata]MDI2127596.1 leucine-rich repeat domain-containing protein [Yinghuangia seranimata]
MTESRLFSNRWAGAVGRGSAGSDRDLCRCLGQRLDRPPRSVKFHNDRQDTGAAGWQHLLELIEEAADDQREEFKPLIELSAEERRQVVTLPPSIAKLTAVRNLVLYGSNLVRIPPEIGAMRSLEEFTPYTSYRLHWLPYEITRCPNLHRSTVSTRALYGNYKYRPPFPALPSPTADGTGELDMAEVDPGTWGTTTIRRCSVCSRPLHEAGLHQAWISLRVATDVLPLLVNACSSECIQALAQPPEDYVRTPHRGGSTVVQPAADHLL